MWIKKVTVMLIIATICCLVEGAVYLQPLRGIKICLDPGQGGELYWGSDKTELVTSELSKIEAAANLRIALFLKSYLTDAGAEVILTRDKYLPPFPDTKRKAEICTQSGCQVFIGIHHNYSRDPSVNYVVSIVKHSTTPTEINLAASISRALSTELNLQNLGMNPQSAEIFNHLNVPGTLVSVGFITDKTFRRQVEKLEYTNTIARGIFKGILEFFQKVKLEPKPSPTPRPIETPSALPTPSSPFIVVPTPLPLKPIIEKTPSLAEVVKPFREVEEAPTPTPAPTLVGVRVEDYKPLFLSPVDGIVDQTWIYGESWGTLPVKKGISFKVSSNSPVRAIANGEILEADVSGKTSTVSPYPNYVLIKHDDKLNGKEVYSLYAQLATISVKKGYKVKAGDVIGTTNAPYATSQRRETEFEFEIRVGGPTQDYVQNPELFIPHKPGTGLIIGRIVDERGNPIKGLRLSGITKTAEFDPYQFSITYGEGVNATDRWNENFAICDVPPGNYTLTTTAGNQQVNVQADKVTFIEWKIK